jgi:hypothetical protein
MTSLGAPGLRSRGRRAGGPESGRAVAVLVALFVAWVMGSGLPANAFASKSPPQVRSLSLVAVQLADLVPDSLLEPAASESTFRLLLAGPMVASGEPAKGITGGYFAVPNPFWGVSDASTIGRVAIRLEREQVYYGPPRDIDSALGAFWAFGLLGLIGKTEDPVVGDVQWRATAILNDSASVTAVGEALFPGSLRSLGRRVALVRANRRSLAVLAARLVDAVDRELKLKPRPLEISSRDYERWVDGSLQP